MLSARDRYTARRELAELRQMEPNPAALHALIAVPPELETALLAFCQECPQDAADTVDRDGYLIRGVQWVLDYRYYMLRLLELDQ